MQKAIKEATMVNITKTRIDSKGRIQLPKTFLASNQINFHTEIVIKPMVNKKNSVALVWKEKNEETDK